MIRNARNTWLALGVSALIAIVPIAWGINTERQWAGTLRELQQRGVQVRASDFRIEHGSRGSGDYVSYRFIPAGVPAMLPPPKIDAATQPAGSIDVNKTIAQMKALQEWSRKALDYNPWYSGGHRISSSVREAIAIHADRTITYLPESPEVSAMGPLTDERIAGEWKRNPVFFVVGIYLGILLSLAIVRSIFGARGEVV